MKLYVIRHAEKEKGAFYNEKFHHQDPPITSRGKRCSIELEKFFADKKLDRIIVSEYLRTAQTARHIAEVKKLQITKDERLNEIDNGEIEQLTDEEIKKKYPEFWNDFFSFSKDVRFPGGETGEECKLRQNDFLVELVKKGEDVLLVTHEGYIRLLLCNIIGLPVYKRHLFHMDYCGVLELEYDDKSGTWQIIRVNQTV